MEWHELSHMAGTKAFQSCDPECTDGWNANVSGPKNHKKAKKLMRFATRWSKYEIHVNVDIIYIICGHILIVHTYMYY